MSRSKVDEDHRADQLNPNNDDYWESRGYDERPDNWEEIIEDNGSSDEKQ